MSNCCGWCCGWCGDSEALDGRVGSGAEIGSGGSLQVSSIRQEQGAGVGECS